MKIGTYIRYFVSNFIDGLILIILFGLLNDVLASDHNILGKSVFGGVPAGMIRDIEVVDEVIFLAAENGVFKIIGDHSERLPHNQSGKKTGIISDIVFDSNGYLWVAEYGVGVFKYDLNLGTSEQFTVKSNSLKEVWNIVLTEHKAVFSLIDGIFIVSLTTREVDTWGSSIFPGNLKGAYNLSAEINGRIYVASRDGLVEIDLSSESVSQKSLEKYFPELSSLTAIYSKSEHLYLGGPEGLYITNSSLKNKQFINFSSEIKAKGETKRIYISNSGKIYVAAGGIFTVRKNEIVPISWMVPMLKHDSIQTVLSINELGNDELILSSSQMGLVSISSLRKAVNFANLDGVLFQNNIVSININKMGDGVLEASNNSLFIIDEEGRLKNADFYYSGSCVNEKLKKFESIYKIKYSEFDFCKGEYNHIFPLSEGLFYAYVEIYDKWKYFLFDNNNILDEIDAPRFVKRSIVLPSGEIVAYDVYSQIHIQLSKYRWKVLKPQDTDWQGITCLITLNDIQLFCTSGSGLQEMDISTGTFSQSDIFEGYDIRFVRAALVSKSNILWLATNMGLYLYDVGSDNLYPLDKSSGVFDVDFEYSGIYEIDGTIVVVGDRYTINEKLLLETLRQEKNHSKKVSIFNVDWTSKKGEFQRYSPIFSSSPLSIGSAYDSLNIKVASSSYLNSYKQNIEFRIMGYIDDWQRHEGSHATITISDIGYGDFEFQSRVSNKSGVNENPIASLTFSINSPFYRSYYAYCIYILLAITLIILFKMGHVGKFAIFIKNTSAIQFFLGRYSNKSKNKVEELAKHRIRMFSNISHELRSPLQIIKNTLEHINNSNGLAENINVGSITANAKKMEALLDQVNEVDRLGECSVNSFKHYSMKDLKHIAISLNSIAKNKRLNLEVKVKGDKTISLLKGSLESIVSILIKNALERAKEGGDIKLIAVINDENLSITITDNGSVIETSSHHKFFSRNHITAQSGLKNGQVQDVALVKELIMINQGAITFESAKAKGTKFFITLPLDDAEEINSQFSENKGWDEKPTILLVDDSREIRNYLFTLLSSNYQCLVARDGRQALDILKNYDVSLIITELTMPIMNGFDFIGKLQQSSYLQRIPVIVLTANVDEKSKERVLSTNVSALLTKPVTDNELELRVKHLVSIGDIALSNKDEEGLEKSVNSFIALPELTTEKDMAFYLNFISVLENNYSNEAFNREKAASELLISVRSLNRRLSELFEYNFSEFLIRFRVDKASDILAGGASVMETCVAVGFGTPSYFSTSFKRIVGVTPRSYASTVGATKKGATESRK